MAARRLSLLLLAAGVGVGCGSPRVATPAPKLLPSAAPAPARPEPAPQAARLYPRSRQQALVETLHGVQVRDPYRWLEDSSSAETKAWV